MKITLLCTDEKHPVNNYLHQWMELSQDFHEISLVRRKQDLLGGDILFLISCSEIVGAEERALYRVSLVIHASKLPQGRGWSPHIWRIIEGAEEVTLSLLEAEDKVDSGRIWQQICFSVPADALWDDINASLFSAEIELINFAVKHFNSIEPQEQDSSIEPTYYPRRTPVDSRIDPDQSIASQFNQVRVCDPGRFPAYFDLHGHRYKITLEKING